MAGAAAPETEAVARAQVRRFNRARCLRATPWLRGSRRPGSPSRSSCSPATTCRRRRAEPSTGWPRTRGVARRWSLIVDPRSPDPAARRSTGSRPHAIADFALGRDDERIRWSRAMRRVEADLFRRASGVAAPLAATGFHAVPLSRTTAWRRRTACCSSRAAQARARSRTSPGWRGCCRKQVGEAHVEAGATSSGRGSDRSGCCSTASSTPSPIRSCSPTPKAS